MIGEWEELLKCDKALVYLAPNYKFFMELRGNNTKAARVNMAEQIKQFAFAKLDVNYKLSAVLDAVNDLSEVYTEIDIAANDTYVSVAAKNYGASCKDDSVIILESYYA